MDEKQSTPDEPDEMQDPALTEEVTEDTVSWRNACLDTKPRDPRRQPVTEEDEIHKDWWDEAKDVTMETLAAFIDHLMNDYAHDYATIVHAMAAGMRAAFYAMDNADQGGITGFQAGCLAWEIFGDLASLDGPARLLEYKKLLYPQYAESFQTVRPSTWAWVQTEAQRLLQASGPVHSEVRQHWEAIVAGTVPFGLRVETEEEDA